MSQAKPKKNRLLIGCLIAGAIGIVVCGGGIGYLFNKYVDFGPAAGEAESAARAYRAAGLPWEAKDLAIPGLKQEDNAAPLLRVADGEFEKQKWDAAARPILTLLTKKDFKGTISKLEPFAQPLSIADQAVQKPSLDFGHDWDEGPNTLFPEMAIIKGMVKALSYRAQAYAGLGDSDKAIHDLREAWKLSVLLGQEPTMIAMLVQIAGEKITLDGIEQCAALEPNNASLRAEMSKLLSQPGALPRFDYALRGETYMGLALIRNMHLFYRNGQPTSESDEPSPVPANQLLRTGLPKLLTERAFAARHMQVWVEAKKAMDKHKNDPEAMGADMDRIATEWQNKKTASTLLIAILFPVFSQAGVAIVDLQAQIEVEQALLAAMDIKQKTGKWPTKIDQIPGTWIDPFTHHPLSVKTSGNEFRVYSFGRNRKDDGGVRQSEIKDTNKKQDSDVVASYPPRQLMAK